MPVEIRLIPLLTDLYNLRVAVNLRLEASVENAEHEDERDKVKMWGRLLKKLNEAIEKAESERSCF